VKQVLKKATVVILIDALGREITEKHGFEVTGLEKVARVKSVLGFSQAAILSIFTSLMPKDHGKWMMYSFASGKSPFEWTRFLPSFIGSERLWFRKAVRFKLERVDRISSYYSLYSVPRPVLPYLDLPLRKDYFKCDAVDGIPTIFDRLRDADAHFKVWDFKSAEDESFNELHTYLDGGVEGFYMLYTAEFDSLLHRYGTGREEIGEKLEYYKRRIERLVETGVERFEELRFFVFGDHGMCDVAETIDVMSGIEKLGLKIPDDYIPFYDSTMARFRVSSDRGKDRLIDFLSGRKGGTVLSEDECSKLGVPVPGDEYGHVVFLADPGVIILPSFMGTEYVSGMHGYHPGSGCMDSVMLSNVSISADELHVTEIAPVILDGLVKEIMGERI